MKKLKLSKIHLFIPGVITISIMCLSTKNPISIDIKIPAIIYEHTGSINSSVSAELKALGIKLMARDSTIVNEINNAKEMYKNPFLRFGITLSEIFPVGLVIALISAVILRKKEILPV